MPSRIQGLGKGLPGLLMSSLPTYTSVFGIPDLLLHKKNAENGTVPL